MAKKLLSDITIDHIRSMIEKDKRVDGRTREEFRPIKIQKNYVATAEGSALVTLGDTKLLVGVKCLIGEPYKDTPNSGVLTTNAELIPMANETFEGGPPNERSIELARVVDRGIREGRAIDFDKLCITPEEEVWKTFVDIHVLDYDGNLFDAANMGAVAALKSAIIPASRFDKGEDFPFPMKHMPISTTFVKLDGYLVVDPNFDEENVARSRLTIATIENGRLCAMQKGLGGSFSRADVEKAIELSLRFGNMIREQIESAGE